MEVHLALESAMMPLVMYLTYEKTRILEIQNSIAKNTEISHEMRQVANIFYYLEEEYNVHLPLRWGSLQHSITQLQ